MKRQTLKHVLMQTTTVVLMIIVLCIVGIPQCVVLIMRALQATKMNRKSAKP